MSFTYGITDIDIDFIKRFYQSGHSIENMRQAELECANDWRGEINE